MEKKSSNSTYLWDYKTTMKIMNVHENILTACNN